jgi:hypothetical protein
MKLSLLGYGTAALSVLLVSIAGLTTGCVGGDCSCSPSGIEVVVSGIKPSEIASVDVSGAACGAVPHPLCDEQTNTCSTQKCDASGNCVTTEATDWEILIPAKAAGDCIVRVELVDGTVIEKTSHVVDSTDGCCTGLAGDPIDVSAKP